MQRAMKYYKSPGFPRSTAWFVLFACSAPLREKNAYDYFAASFLPADKLSKFMIALNTRK
jgi:hypothetical protein